MLCACIGWHVVSMTILSRADFQGRIMLVILLPRGNLYALVTEKINFFMEIRSGLHSVLLGQNIMPQNLVHGAIPPLKLDMEIIFKSSVEIQ